MEKYGDPVAFYRQCLKWVIDSGFEDRVIYFRQLQVAGTDIQDFFEEYVHVVLASGFKWAIVEKYKPLLAPGFRQWKISAIARDPDSVFRQAQSIFRHTKKIKAIIDTALELSKWTADEYTDFIDMVATLDGDKVLRMLRTFPYIGPITQYHLARNLGLDFPKPDIHLCRAAAKFGYPPNEEWVFRFVDVIANFTSERPGTIDYVIWKYMESHPSCS
jgi:hypothetical protein